MKLQLRNWIYLTPGNPLWQGGEPTRAEFQQQDEIAAMVRDAISQLGDTERLVIEKHYFEGKSYSQIAEECGRSAARIIHLHGRALRSLQKLLAKFARDRYGIETVGKTCIICRSPFRHRIDALIARKKPSDTYRDIIRKLKLEYGIAVTSPQTIIGHRKYHC